MSVSAQALWRAPARTQRRPQAIDDAPACGPEPSGGWRRRDPRLRGGMLSWLARNGRAGVPARLRGGPPGEESLAAAIAARRSRLCRPAARSSHQEAVRVARQTACVGEDVAERARARGRVQWAKEQKRWTERRCQLSRTRHDIRITGTGLSTEDIAAARSKRHRCRYRLGATCRSNIAKHSTEDTTKRDLSCPWPRMPRRTEICIRRQRPVRYWVGLAASKSASESCWVHPQCRQLRNNHCVAAISALGQEPTFRGTNFNAKDRQEYTAQGRSKSPQPELA